MTQRLLHSIQRRIRDQYVFIRQFLAEFESTGTLFATTRFAAAAMTTPLRGQLNGKPKRRILEIGPGTGSITRRILEDMHEADELIISEINPSFLSELKRNLEDNPHYIAHKSRIRFIEGPAQELNIPRGSIDMVVCAVPFLNLPLEISRQIFSKIGEFSHKGTFLTFYEYYGFRQLSKLLPLPARQARIAAYEELFDDEIKPQLLGSPKVWLNIPPVNVYLVDAENLFSPGHEAEMRV